MKFFEDVVARKIKTGQEVCGDYCLSQRTAEGTLFVLCDGIGSGVYANIAAITCAGRVMELLRRGISARAVSETVASSMHKARKENIPFSAFSLAVIRPNGQFSVYHYEAPPAILMRGGTAEVLSPGFYTAGYEVIGEANGVLDYGDTLILSSDGVTQSGMGHGYGFGIGAEGVAGYINQLGHTDAELGSLPDRIMEHCVRLSGGRCEDDITFAMLRCRPAAELTLLTGPPSRLSADPDYVRDFMEAPGRKVVSRETGKKVEVVKPGLSLGSPPEYLLEGIDLATEGAVVLNQAYNILGEPVELLAGKSVVERLCVMLTESDAIHLMVGNAENSAHEALLFKQVGIRLRKKTVGLIAEKLREMGKLVTEKGY